MTSVISCFLTAVVSLLLASTANAGALQFPGLSAEETALHKRAIESERRGLFHEAWVLAGPERRALVQALLELHAASSSAQRDQPDLELLSLATRILMGAEGARIQNDPLVRLADGIDVFTSPVSIHGERASEQGEVITVGVRLMKPMTQAQFPAQQVELSLAWLQADGSLMESAVSSHELEEFNAGFPVVLRTLRSPSGTQHLVPTLRVGQTSVRGWAIPVPLVKDLNARIERLQNGSRLMGELVYVLKWRRIWVRRSDRLGPEEWLRRMEAGEVGGTLWSPDVLLRRPEVDRPTVLLVAASTESAAGLLAGPMGAAWVRAAESHDFHLAAVDGIDLVGAKLKERLEGLVRETGSERLILVARGDAALGLSLSLPIVSSTAIEAMILVNSFGAPMEKISKLPTLLVGCDGDPARDGAHVERLDAPRTLLLADTVLLEHFLTWFESHRSRSPKK